MQSVKKICWGTFVFCAGLMLSHFASGETSSVATLELNNSQYLRANEIYFRDGANEQATSWRFGWKADVQKRGWFGRLNLRNDYVAEENYNYVKPFDLNAGWQNDRFKLSLGRERMTWSESDDFWRLGTWQPRFVDDLLAREAAGLTGAFLTLKGDTLEATAFASPVWSPDIGPHFDLRKEAFYSANPWFHPPTSRVYLENNLTDIHYRFDRPDVASIASHGMGGGQVLYKPTDRLTWRLSGMFKPINQLLIGFPISLRLQDPNYAEVDVKTRVVYHQVATLEGSYRDDEWQSFWSLTSDRPLRDNPPADWTTQEVSDAVIGSIMIGKDVRGQGVNATNVYASYLRVEGGDAPDRGEIIGSQSFFERRYMFKDAAMVGVRHTMPWFGSKYLTRLNASTTYDFSQHGMAGSLQLKQPLSKYWTAHLAGDFIGLVDRSGKTKDGFFSTYRANDRLSLGVSYVF